VSEDRVDLILRQWARERPDLDASPMEVIGRIMRMSRHLERELQTVYQRYGLDFGLFDVLATLRRSGAPYRLSPKELNDWCMLTSGAMTARLDRLEKSGLVARRADPGDRRGILVELSPAGLALIDDVVEQHLVNEERLLAPLGARERVELARLLRQLVAPIEANGERRASLPRVSDPTRTPTGESAIA
jgi:DNA-binding MarR family transcriptional regulator